MHTYRMTTVLLLILLLVSLAAGSVRAQGSYQVAILVVDDFNGVELSDIPTDQFEPDQNCAVSLEGQAYAFRGSSDAPITDPHGELVSAQLEDLIADAGAESSISLVQVDVHGVTTEEAASRIQDAINNNPADAYVINMSFVILPCEYIQAFADFGGQMAEAKNAGDMNRHRSLFQRAVLFYNDTVFPVMSNKAQQATDLDPLQELLVSVSDRAIPVAAAGNFGLDFPFWPGAWGQVISVSASAGQGWYPASSWDKQKDMPLLGVDTGPQGKKKRVSNYGEVMMPGEYAHDEGMLTGTSFAAPRLSFALALYLTQVGPNFCRNDEGYPALDSGEWDNLTLQEAAQQYCPDLVPYLPAG